MRVTRLPKTTFFFISMALYFVLMPFFQYPIITVIKPIPIFCLMVITLQSKARYSIKLLLLMSLGSALLGDVVLTLPLKKALQGGIGCFMLAHIGYVCLFLKDSKIRLSRIFYFLPILVSISMGYYWLWPHLGEKTVSVTIYFCLLMVMVFSAFQVKQCPLLIIGGACLFLLSDFSLALSLFVPINNLMFAFFIMGSYYVAQLLLVTGLSRRDCKGID